MVLTDAGSGRPAIWRAAPPSTARRPASGSKWCNARSQSLPVKTLQPGTANCQCNTDIWFQQVMQSALPAVASQHPATRDTAGRWTASSATPWLQGTCRCQRDLRPAGCVQQTHLPGQLPALHPQPQLHTETPPEGGPGTPPARSLHDGQQQGGTSLRGGQSTAYTGRQNSW